MSGKSLPKGYEKGGRKQGTEIHPSSQKQGTGSGKRDDWKSRRKRNRHLRWVGKRRPDAQDL